MSHQILSNILDTILAKMHFLGKLLNTNKKGSPTNMVKSKKIKLKWVFYCCHSMLN